MALQRQFPAVLVIRDTAELIDRAVPVFLRHQFLRGFIETRGRFFPCAGVTAQGQEDRPGIIVAAIRFQLGCPGHIGFLIQLRPSIIVLRQQGQRIQRSLPVSLFHQHPGPDQIRLIGLVHRFRLVHCPQHRGSLCQRLSGCAFLRRLQGNPPVTLRDHFIRSAVGSQHAEDRFRFGRFALFQRVASGAQPEPGRSKEKHSGSQGRCRDHRDTGPDTAPAAVLFLPVFLFADPLQADRILPHTPAVQVQLPLLHIDLCFHGFRAEAGENGFPVPSAADTVFCFIQIGPAADANPQAVLLARVPYRGLAGSVLQVCQRRAHRKIVRYILHRGSRIPPPGFIVRVPDLLNRGCNGFQPLSRRARNRQQESGMRPPVQRPSAKGQPFCLAAVFVQKVQQNLDRGDHPVAEVEQGQGGRRDFLRRHRCSEDFGRTG